MMRTTPYITAPRTSDTMPAMTNTTAQATYEARGWKRDREYFAYHFTSLS